MRPAVKADAREHVTTVGILRGTIGGGRRRQGGGKDGRGGVQMLGIWKDGRPHGNK